MTSNAFSSPVNETELRKYEVVGLPRQIYQFGTLFLSISVLKRDSEPVSSTHFKLVPNHFSWRNDIIQV